MRGDTGMRVRPAQLQRPSRWREQRGGDYGHVMERLRHGNFGVVAQQADRGWRRETSAPRQSAETLVSCDFSRCSPVSGIRRRTAGTELNSRRFVSALKSPAANTSSINRPAGSSSSSIPLPAWRGFLRWDGGGDLFRLLHRRSSSNCNRRRRRCCSRRSWDTGRYSRGC